MKNWLVSKLSRSGHGHISMRSQTQLEDLRRMRETRVTHCQLSSARDERCTDIERRFDDRILTIRQATKLVRKHGAQIERSIFQAKIS